MFDLWTWKNGYDVKQQLNVPITYEDITFDGHLKLDLLVNNLVIVEIKAQEELHPIYEAQLLTYMKILKKPQGLLINFFTDNITKSMKPLINELFNTLPN